LSQLKIDDSSDFSFNGGSPDKPFSLSWFMKADGTSSTQYLFHKKNFSSQGEYYCWMSANKIYFAISNVAGAIYIYVSAPYTSTAWKFITCTYDGSGVYGGLKIYIDGVESESAHSSAGTYAGMGNSTSALYWGLTAASAYPFLGSVAKLTVWNKVITSEIALAMALDARY
jgi:hypothetical protein